MKKMVKPARIVALLLIFTSILTLYGSSLYEMQVVSSGDYVDSSVEKNTITAAVAAARGDLLDRNGNVLVTSVTVYNVKVSRTQILAAENTNEIIRNLVYTAIENDVKYNDSFPVTISPVFEYVDMTETQTSRLASYLDYFGLEADISASDLIVWMKDHYDIDYTTSLEDARLIIGVRYELELRVITNIPEYTFADDVDVDFVSILLEKSYTGVSVDTTSERQYCTQYAAHMLGYVGLMNAEEYEKYKNEGYSMDAIVGKSGVEAAFEQYLHGTDGSEKITTAATGEVLNVETVDEAQAGENVYLTLDIGLQAVAEESLEARIAAINSTRGSDDELASGGAVVVLDVNTGDVLVCASYPSYDISTFTENYAILSQDPSLPLFDRATQGTYAPGSTFKMVTSFAGLSSQLISRWTTFTCTGVFTKYGYTDFEPQCWVYPDSHGTQDLVGAIENSCNYYFFSVADLIGGEAMASAAEQFGLDSKTGIEIGEAIGTISSPKYAEEELDQGWWAADNLLTAIGQGYNSFTPIEICDYISTIANGGTLYKTTLLEKVMSADYRSLVFQNTPAINSTVADPNNYISILQQGMEAVAETGTASSMFANYPVEVAAKTGTVQSDASDINNGVFVCYAPADNPEIAIALVVENGGSGSKIMAVAEDILDAYFGEGTEYNFTIENTLIP